MPRSIAIRPTWLLLMLCALALPARAGAGCKALLGSWVVPVQDRNLMLLVVEPVAGKPAATAFGGSLTAPAHLSWSRNSFSEINGGNRRRAITQARCEKGTLQLVIEKAERTGDGNRFSFTSTDGQRASLQLRAPSAESGSIAPFRFVRAQGTPVLADDWDDSLGYEISLDPVSNAEMLRMFNDEENELRRRPVDTARFELANEGRRTAIRRLLDSEALRSGEDFRRAAFVFQHGPASDDYLMAHTLATIALRRGETEASWIAAASLDRYLASIHQPQIYGTQFDGGPLTREPFDRGLISDRLRVELGVPIQAEQEREHTDAVERSMKPTPTPAK